MKEIQKTIDFLSGKKAKDKMPKRKFDPTKYDLYNDIREGDIIVTRLEGSFYGGVICHMTSSPYPHAEIHIEDGYVISATPHGVGFVDEIKDNIKRKGRLDVLRLKDGLTREQRLIIQEKAYETLLKPYDYFNLVSFPFMSDEKAAQYSGNRAYICSEHVSWTYKNAGIDLIAKRPEAIEAPVDIAKSDALVYIGTYENGNRMNGEFRNEFIDEEISWLQKLASKFMGIFSKRDEYYEGLEINRSKMLGET